MPKWLMIILGVLLVCVLGTVVGGRVLRDKFANAISEPVELAISASVSDSVGEAIQFQSLQSGELRLTTADIDMNTYECASGEQAIDIVNDQASLCGVETILNADGLEVGLIDMVYRANPAVYQDRLELEQSEFEKGLFGHILSKDAFENGIKTGINDALAQAELKPVSVSMDSALMVIVTEPIDN